MLNNVGEAGPVRIADAATDPLQLLSVAAAVSAAESTKARAARPPLQPPATVLDLAASPSSDFPLEKSATWPEIGGPRFSSLARKYFNSCSTRNRCCERRSNPRRPESW